MSDNAQVQEAVRIFGELGTDLKLILLALCQKALDQENPDLRSHNNNRPTRDNGKEEEH